MTAPLSRRSLLAAMTAGGMAAVVGGAAAAEAEAAAPGVQLWMVRQSMAADLDGTLAALADMGVRIVEMAGAPALAAADFRRRFGAAGLNCVSAHKPVLQMRDDELDRQFAFCAELGVSHIVAPMPGFAALLALEPDRRLEALLAHQMTRDDWLWNAERLNRAGERAKAAGLRLGYHNHNIEFGLIEGERPMDILLREVEPALAGFQLDVGNAVLGGADPFDLVARHPGRFESAHLKDWAAPLIPTTQLASPASAAFGKGVIDWPRWVEVAHKGNVLTAFIERENLSAEGERPGAAQGVNFFKARNR